jgi:hypothetical protein
MVPKSVSEDEHNGTEIHLLNDKSTAVFLERRREGWRKKGGERRERSRDSALSFPETAEALLSAQHPPAGEVTKKYLVLLQHIM